MRRTVRFLSELCITVGVLIILFVVHVVFWTGIQAADAADAELARLEDRWAQGRIESRAPPAPASAVPPKASADPAPGAVPTPGGEPSTAPERPRGTTQAPPATRGPAAALRAGEPFAVMYIPRFGRGWDWPVLEGTAVATLKKGLGHYRSTARPGERGNIAVAGHRRTYGDPFKDMPRLRPGDAIVLTDGTTWYTYRVARRPFRTVPSDIGVVDPVPRGSPFTRPGRYLTLTTCEPEWGSSHRLIVWARLAGTRAVTDGKPEALLS
ncbi:class E sortase [Streptomyces sp. NPDC000594]|uniref:class E sortase n=1 Tax=Streptomyces sp. NPDC000594 TaxID=3154261 RepID=UPI00332161A5